ncbi:MAG TPA: hypothetical protein VFU22_23465 [Roseiflexaceae bacterium]|nr:hypothetical protein [Roseiflexaceae bacterium]
MHMSLRIGLMIGLGTIMGGTIAPAYAQADVTHYNETFIVEDQFIGFDGCPESTGEAMLGQGTVHVEGIVVYDAGGNAHFQAHTNVQGFVGVGLTTGTTYQLPTIQNSSQGFEIDGVGSTYTYVSNCLISGAGPNNGSHAHATIHMTLNANGEPTAEVEHITGDCEE